MGGEDWRHIFSVHSHTTFSADKSGISVCCSFMHMHQMLKLFWHLLLQECEDGNDGDDGVCRLSDLLLIGGPPVAGC